MKRPRNNRTSHNRQSGFTLFEMLLSMGLSLTLLTILFAAMDLHWRFSTQGHTEVERAQVARAVLNKMAIDIRSVVYKPEETGDPDTPIGDGSEDEADAVAAAQAETTVAEYSDPSEAFAGASLGVFGDNQTLILHIVKPTRLPFNASGEPDSDDIDPNAQSNTRSVSYFLAGGEGALQQMIGNELAGTTINTEVQGLVRMGGDRATMVQADSNGDLQAMAAHAKLLAPEIEAVSFEYHDGFEWLTEWDSEIETRVPNAIGITITFKEPDYPPNAINRENPSAMTREYRLVVPLGVANPFAGQAL
jgi:hypothetical protein